MKKTAIPVKKINSGTDFLEYLNTAYNKLHSAYESAFWISYMGDHSVDAQMNTAMEKRDAFRSDQALKAQAESLLKKSNGSVKDRLKLWINFFSLYQTPAHAAPIKKRVTDIEAKILKIRSKRREGYVDPKNGKFVEASENKMRMILRTNPDETVRKACFESLQKIPMDTLKLYVEMIRGRNEFARALGYEDFYAYKARIDEDMTKKELFSIFENLYQKTKYGFKPVRDLEKKKSGLRKPWNFSYMMAGNFIKEEDPYFSFENVLSYWGRSFAALGIDFQKGSLTLDLLDRKGKWNNGFCHYPALVQYKNGRRIPGSSGFTSNALPGQVGSGVQGIDTVFHEGGHAADRLNSMQPDACVNHEYPPSSVSWAETHSMFMDSISSSIEWRTRYASTAAGKSYPFELFERKVRALHVLRPLDMMSICSVVFFEKEIYECADLTEKRVLEIARKISRKYSDFSEDSILILNVPHTYSWESSAYYHGYGLAELCVAQWREYFFKKYGYIVDNKNIGKEMTKIWSYASRYPAKQLVKMATGKALSPDAYIADVTASLETILKRAKSRVERLTQVPKYTKPVRLNARITMVHGKKKIADNAKSFEDMDMKYRKWLKMMSDK